MINDISQEPDLNIDDENSETVDTNTDSLNTGMCDDYLHLTKKTVLKRVFANYSLKDITKIIENLKELCDERKKSDLDKAMKSSEQETEVLKLLENIKRKGIDVDILYKRLNGNNIDASLNNYKYEYTDSEGIVHYWSGKGRIPSPMAEQMKLTGKTKEDFLRSETSQNS